MQKMIQDLVYACRFFNRNRGMFLAAVLSLGLGIGAGTGFFSVVQGVLLEKLPVRNPDQLVLLRWEVDPKVHTGVMNGWSSMTDDGLRTSTSLPFPTYEYLKEHNRALESIFAFAPLSGLNLGASRDSRVVRGELVSGNYFSSLGLTATAGRLIQKDDDREGSEPVVVFSYRFWQEFFGGDPGILGRTVRVNTHPMTVVGIAPPAFEGTSQLGETSDLFAPLSEMKILHHWKERTTRPDGWWVQVMGRLSPGASRIQAQSALNVLFQQNIQPVILSKNPKKSGAELHLPELRLEDGARGRPEVRKSMIGLLETGAFVVALLLLIACVNTATLLVAKAPSRRREMAVRLSLGAGRARLLRQLLTESLLLSFAAGAVGLLVAFFSRDLMVGLLAEGGSSDFHLNVGLNWTVLSFTAAASILVGVAFGLVPALAASSVELVPSLKESSGSLTQSRGARLLGRCLVAAQVALVMVILVSAGLLLATLKNLASEPLGFKPENLLVFGIDPGSNQYDAQKRLALYGSLKQRIQSLEAVRSVSYSSHRLLAGTVSMFPFLVKGKETGSLFVNHVGPDFFHTMGIRVLLGRGIEARDVGGRAVVVVSEDFARQFFKDENPVGHLIEPSLGEIAPLHPELAQKFEIVGVVGDSKYPSIRSKLRPTVFMAPQKGDAGLSAVDFCVRLAGPGALVIPKIKEVVRGQDANIPIYDVQFYRVQVEQSYSKERQFALITAAFSLVGLLLAAIGLYGTLSHSVASRTREFGLRGALGASPGRIQVLVMKELVVVGIGLLAGVAGTVAVGRLLANLLYGLGPTSPTVMMVAGLVLLVTGLVASYLPARRASRVDPASALRFE